MKYATPTWTPTKEQRLKMRREAAAAAQRLAKKNGITTTEDCLREDALLPKYMRILKEKYKTGTEGIPRLRVAPDARPSLRFR